MICTHIPAGTPVPDSCQWCWLALYDDAFRAARAVGLPRRPYPPVPFPIGGSQPPAGRPPRKPLPTLAEVPCLYRGALISECSGCGGKKPERHTYACDHPEADWDLCVPVPKKDVEWPKPGELRACRRCPLRPGAPAGSVPHERGSGPDTTAH